MSNKQGYTYRVGNENYKKPKSKTFYYKSGMKVINEKALYNSLDKLFGKEKRTPRNFGRLVSM